MHGDARSTPRRRARLGGGLLAVALATGVLATGGLAATAPPAGADVSAGTPPPEAFILVDTGTGAVITERNMHEALPPASTAKLMTALVAVERLPPNATIDVSQDAADREAMKIGMQSGSRWPFSQAMASMMMVSANDAAYAVAQTVGGSTSGFAAIANATARRLGMRDSTFGDPAGLDDSTSYNGGPRVSAYDLAIAARNVLSVPAIAHWADTVNYQFTDTSGVHHTLTNHDKFLEGNGFGYQGADGMKTGYTERADHTLVAAAKRGGRQCVAVILGSVDSGYTWAASLLDKCWVKPPVATTGVFLPPVRVSPYESRVQARASFTKLAVGRAVPAGGSGSSRPTPTTAAHHDRAPRGAHHGARPGRGTHARGATGATKLSGSARTIAARRAATTSTTVKPSSHHGVLTPTRLLFLLLLVLVAAVALRRRAVKRQRARRMARRRARARAIRSGSLPVVDGSYRDGPQREARVRVSRSYIDLTDEDAPRARRSRARD